MSKTLLLALLPIVLGGAFLYFNNSKRSTITAAPPVSNTKGVAVVELFTSEGCSSCPPADRLLMRLAEEARSNGTTVIPLSFHVDYWNRLGWRDPFSDAAYSRRQEAYSRALGLDGLYTPQMIVNGRTEFVGSNASHASDAIEKALATTPKAEVAIQVLRTNDELVNIRYDVTGANDNDVVNIALVQRQTEVHVPRGENEGRTLRHGNVVRAYQSVPLSSSSGEVELRRPSDVEGLSIVAYVQNPKTMAITGGAASELKR